VLQVIFFCGYSKTKRDRQYLENFRESVRKEAIAAERQRAERVQYIMNARLMWLKKKDKEEKKENDKL
jgi:hypothetical protein